LALNPKNPKQKRFAEEYAVDHNGTQAAIRAGYSEKTAAVAASKMLAKPDIRQMVQKLDAEHAEALGIEKQEVLQRILDDWNRAREMVPKIWKGEPVTYEVDVGGGEMVEVVATEFRSPAVMTKAMELLFRHAGCDVSKDEIEQKTEVTFRLKVPRELDVD
jgi:phage terminase small subunit